MSEIDELKRQIAHHNKLYYEQSSPEISDEEYDFLTKRLRELTSSHVDLFTFGLDLTQTKFAKIPHRSPMLSLGNVFDEDELRDFIKKVNNFLNTEGEFYEFTAEKKIDGVSFSALYENGTLVHILTRGDGEIGENITENILTIEGFPTKISTNSVVEVRGEVYMLNSDFEELNRENAKTGGKIFANPRNAASGSLRQLDSTFTKARNLKYYAYSGIFHDENITETLLTTQGKIYTFLSKNGFYVNDYAICNSIELMLNYYNSVAKHRFQIGYDIDGIVYKINSIFLQKRLGTTANAPRWAVAHKFSSKKAQTKLENIILQVGRTGIITPVAELLPVNLGGVVIKRATLHNKDEIYRLGVNVGDIIEIERAGDVIPKILKVCEKNPNSIPTSVFEFPINCPCCGFELTQAETLIRCMNFASCKEQNLGRFKYFVSKECFNIVGLGERQIEEFFNQGFIKTFSDIFLLPEKISEMKLKNWEGWGEISVKNLINAINVSKKVALYKMINSFGIYSVGMENAKILAGFFKSGENLTQEISFAMQLEKLIELDGIGEKTAKEVVSYLKINREEITKLLSITDVYHEEQISGDRGAILFTGTLSISRAEAKEMAQKAGFSIASSVSKALEYLICGEDSGLKLKKAPELGVKILNEVEFLDLCRKI